MAQEKKPPATICYARGTNARGIEEEIKATFKHANGTKEPWVSPGTAENVADTINSGDVDPGEPITVTEGTTAEVARQLMIHHDRVDRESKLYGLNAMVTAAKADHVKHVVVAEAGRVAMSEFEAVRRLCENDVQVHLARDGITIHKLTDDVKFALETLADAPRSTPGGVKHEGGRPPLAFKVEAGILRPSDDYDRVCRVLRAVRSDRLTDQEAADELGCVRKTIHNALDRPSMYRLE